MSAPAIRTWRRDYPDGSFGTVSEAELSYVGVYHPSGGGTGIIRFTLSLELARIAVDGIASQPPAPHEWLLSPSQS
jgi:hypothetical protein